MSTEAQVQRRCLQSIAFSYTPEEAQVFNSIHQNDKVNSNHHENHQIEGCVNSTTL